MKRVVLLLSALTGFTACGIPLHTEMLGESIKLFATKTMKPNNEKVWITGPADSACDSGCQNGCGGGKDKGALGGGGGLFGGLGKSDGGSSYDRLAYEVFANYFTQKKKMRVIETHRHNYQTELNVDTRKKIELMSDQGKPLTTMSCEDLCLLDEAKKRKADKVLAYHIIEMKNEEMTIQFRLSDVPTGVVEASQTIKVLAMRAFDASPASFAGRKNETTATPEP